jgi:uncharacterized membrane protein
VSKVPASTIASVSSLETRFVMTRLLFGAVIGLCVGALIGGLAFSVLASDTTATAFLRLQNPADLTAIAGGASQVTPDNQANSGTFAAGEIAYLSGDGFARAVADKMAQDEPAELNIAQASESTIVTISCSRKSDDEAVRTVQTAIDLYGQDLEKRMDTQLRTILPKLSEWQQRDAADPVRTLELQRVVESVELQAAQASTLLVVQPPTPNRPSSQQWLIGVFLGALVGAAGGAAVMVAGRRRRGRGSLVKVLAESVDAVLVPSVDLDIPSREAWADEQERLGRSLYTQCRSAGPTRLILVIGASVASGSSVVAALLETAAAENHPASLSTGQHSSPTSAEPPTTRIVSGGAVGDSTLTTDLLGAATDIVLVARLESDTVEQTMALCSATACSAAPVVAVFTYRRGKRFGKRGPKGPTQNAGALSDHRGAQ